MKNFVKENKRDEHLLKWKMKQKLCTTEMKMICFLRGIKIVIDFNKQKRK